MQNQNEIQNTKLESFNLQQLVEDIDGLEVDESLRFRFAEDPSPLITKLIEEFGGAIRIQAHREGPASWTAELVKLKDVGCCGCCGGHD